MDADRVEDPPIKPGRPSEPPQESPPGNPRPEIPPPMRDPGESPQAQELPGQTPDELPVRGPAEPSAPPAPIDSVNAGLPRSSPDVLADTSGMPDATM